ncbi:hypothetical protein ACVNPZ_14090 [Staphylococcus aureus]
MPFFSDKKALWLKMHIYLQAKSANKMAHNVDQLIEFIEKYDG